MAVPARVSDSEQFADFDATYRSRVAGLARRFVRADAVDDVVQETLLRAYRADLHRDQDRDPWPWLATVARNLCHDHHRRCSLREHPAEDAVDERSSVGADTSVEQTVRAQFVAHALGQLPDAQRRLLIAHHVEGTPCRTIAAAEATTVEAVKSGLARARAAFRARYEGWRGWLPPLVAPGAAHLRSFVGSLSAPFVPFAPLARLRAAGMAALLALLMASAPPSPAGEGGSGESARPPTVDLAAPARGGLPAPPPAVDSRAPEPGPPEVDPEAAPGGTPDAGAIWPRPTSPSPSPGAGDPAPELHQPAITELSGLPSVPAPSLPGGLPVTGSGDLLAPLLDPVTAALASAGPALGPISSLLP